MKDALYRLAPAVPALVTALSGCADSPGAAETAMFRGTPNHSGVYVTESVDRLGGELWRFATRGPVRSTPAVAGGLVYVGSSDGHLYALYRATGRERWRADAGSPVNSSPAVANGLVLFGSRDGAFHAVDASSGTFRWQFGTGDLVPWEWGFEGWDAYTSSPVVVDSVAVFGAGDGVLYAVDLQTGAERWRFATGGRIRSSPAVADGAVFVGSADGYVYAVDLATGQERWRHETEGVNHVSAEWGFDRKSVISSPAVVNGTVYVGSRDGFLYALDRETGERRWRADHAVSWAMSSPAVLDDVVYSGTSDGEFVQALDAATGEERWRVTAAGYTWSSPAVAGNTVYIGDAGGYLRAIDRLSGEQRWSYRAGDAVLSSPVVSQGVVFFGSDDGHVYALHGEGAAPRRAVFWDAAFRDLTFYQSHAETRSYFAQHGYEVLGAEGLAAFMDRAIADGRPSVVVFAMDHLPPTVAGEPSDTVLFRRYLDAGGTVLWLGLPPMIVVRDPETGRFAALDRDRPGALLGVDHGSANFDFYGTSATEEGRRSGVPDVWISMLSVGVAEGIEVLGLDENGRAGVWRKRFGGGPGSGFIAAYGQRRSLAELPALETLAEFGLGAVGSIR